MDIAVLGIDLGVFIHHRELKIAVERRARYGLPHKSFNRARTAQQFDLNHKKRRKKYTTELCKVSKIAQTAFPDRHKLQVRGPHEWRPTWNGSSGARTLSATVTFWNT
jgi:hypothetical protein